MSALVIVILVLIIVAYHKLLRSGSKKIKSLEKENEANGRVYGVKGFLVLDDVAGAEDFAARIEDNDSRALSQYLIDLYKRK